MDIYRDFIRAILSFKQILKYCFIVFIIIAHCLLIKIELSYGMGDNTITKDFQIYEYNGQKIVSDLIYWQVDSWFRATSYLLPGIDKFTALKDASTSIHSTQFENYRNYDRIDLVYYCPGLHSDGIIGVTSYQRKEENEIYVTDKFEDLDKPYIRLGTFTVGGRVPANWKKVKSKIKIRGAALGGDAVVVEKAQTLAFKKEDYLPITVFQHPQYVLYTCVAVVYEDNAYIPDYLKVFVTEDDFYFPYEKIEEFTVDYKTTTRFHWWRHLRKVAYEKYKADGVRVIKLEELTKGGLFSKGMTRYSCQALRFPDKIKEQFVIHPDTDIEALMKQKVQY